MNRILQRIRKNINLNFVVVNLFFILLGLLMIAISVDITHQQEGLRETFSEFLKELGIVVLAVFTVSLLYELLVAKRYHERFINLLGNLMKRGDSNRAACARLGITQIFPSRNDFERDHPLASLTSNFASGSSIRIVAQSLNHLMNNPKVLKEAIRNGAQVELAIFDPKSTPSEIDKHPDLILEDLEGTVAVFKRNIVNWLKKELPTGGIELRYHQVLIFDSFVHLKSEEQNLIVWDWGFGRDLAAHRILMLDPKEILGLDILERYKHVWKDAKAAFKYENKVISTDCVTNTASRTLNGGSS